MLSRITFAAAYGLLGFLAVSEVANAASDKVKVGVGVAILVVVAMGLLTAIYAVKWYFGATEPPALPPGGLPYHSLPAGGDAHGHDGHGGGHH
jgi:hypothetical protein